MNQFFDNMTFFNPFLKCKRPKNQIKPIKHMSKNYQIIKRTPEGDQKLKT